MYYTFYFYIFPTPFSRIRMLFSKVMELGLVGKRVQVSRAHRTWSHSFCSQIFHDDVTTNRMNKAKRGTATHMFFFSRSEALMKYACARFVCLFVVCTRPAFLSTRFQSAITRAEVVALELVVVVENIRKKI